MTVKQLIALLEKQPLDAIVLAPIGPELLREARGLVFTWAYRSGGEWFRREGTKHSSNVVTAVELA